MRAEDSAHADAHQPVSPWWGPAGRADLVGGGLRAFSAIAWHWDLSDADAAALLGVGTATYAGWSCASMFGLPLVLPEPVRDALLTRLRAVGEIDEKTRTTHGGSATAAAAWMRRPNPDMPFGGRAPVDLLIAEGARGIGLVCAYVVDWGGASPETDE